MVPTRRRFTGLVWGSVFAAGLARGVPALARGDDDDGPPNVFFSPAGRPYRAPPGAPYPVVDWFRQADRNGDGKLDHDEFIADASTFFDLLDLNGDGVLDAREIAIYERRIAPEVLGMRVTVYADLRPRAAGAARLWLAQYASGPEYGPNGAAPAPGLPGGGVMPGEPMHGGDPNEGGVLPQDVEPNAAHPNANPDLGGATPYSLIAEPEPVTAADPDYLFMGVVKKARFLSHASDNFALLDRGRAGYLTAAGLPQTPVERQLDQRRGKG
jgi:hypothetical protein